MNPSLKPYRILLFYQYVVITDPELFARTHLKFCRELGLKGRILVASEGINGTVSGTVNQTDQYMAYMQQNPLFHKIEFKIDEADGHAFQKLFVRPRSEIVSLRLEDDINPNEITGTHLSPVQFYEQIQREDVLILDGRNDYEYDIGHFRGAVRPQVESFRDFPEWIRANLDDYKDKPILTYCTGGIRCEKLSGFLLQEGFKNVAQLQGGILTYGKDPAVKGQLFDGKCFVFDDRIAVPINQVEEVIVGLCRHCGQPADQYINCALQTCDLMHICCPSCEDKYKHFCSEACEFESTHKG